jgi:hypothetical protein
MIRYSRSGESGFSGILAFSANNVAFLIEGSLGDALRNEIITKSVGTPSHEGWIDEKE